MTRRFTGLLAAPVSAVMLLAAACTSSASSPTPAQSVRLSPQQALPLFMQCLAAHNVPIWDKAQGDTNVVSLGEKEGWYQNGRVAANNALYTDAGSFEGFYPIGSGFRPEQTIGAWLDSAAKTGTWPKVCGQLPVRT